MGQILRAGKCLYISFTAAAVQLPSRAKPTYFVMAEHSAFAWKKKLSPMGGADVKQKVFLRLTIIFINENNLSLCFPAPFYIFSFAPFYDQSLTSEKLLLLQLIET